MAPPYVLSLFALDESLLSTTSHATKEDLKIKVLLCQARIDRREADSDGRVPCRFDIDGVEYNEWRTWIK
jgi:hypothetical protein